MLRKLRMLVNSEQASAWELSGSATPHDSPHRAPQEQPIIATHSARLEVNGTAAAEDAVTEGAAERVVGDEVRAMVRRALQSAGLRAAAQAAASEARLSAAQHASREIAEAAAREAQAVAAQHEAQKREVRPNSDPELARPRGAWAIGSAERRSAARESYSPLGGMVLRGGSSGVMGLRWKKGAPRGSRRDVASWVVEGTRDGRATVEAWQTGIQIVVA